MESNKAIEPYSVDQLDTCIQPFCTSLGDLAPTFTANALVNDNIQEVDLLKKRGKWLILLFYSSNFTFV